jgi:VanZ family protein
VKARVIRILLGFYTAGIAVVVFWPTPVDRPVASRIRTAVGAVQEVGATSVSYDGVEVAANVLMFMPLGALLVLAFPRLPWWWAPIAAGLFSCAIEFVQFAFVALRNATWGDVVANTSGAVIGAVAVYLIRMWSIRRSRQRGAAGLP